MDLYNEKIFIAEICLRYEPRPTIIHEWTRERYARELRQARHNSYLKRVTIKDVVKIENENYKEQARKAYDKAIMDKYNVPSNYRENRWFMEQVRPNI